jgi:hypothetical protein
MCFKKIWNVTSRENRSNLLSIGRLVIKPVVQFQDSGTIEISNLVHEWLFNQ